MANNRLLLIEDDYDVAEMLIMYFQSHQYEVLHADSGTDGIELARTKFPNLILLDIMMPDMDGYDVCITLRQTAMTKYIPILFLTQRDERASKVKGLEIGADDYITKPFDIDELRLRVQGSIRRATRENLHESRTGLPTGQMISEELSRKQAGEAGFETLTYEIENFKSYHDVYGFMAAGEVIKHAAATIQEVISVHGTQNDFIGIKDDTFIIMTHTDAIETVDATIRARFNEQVRAFYSFIDADRGGVLIDEGTEYERLVPLMTISGERRSAADVVGS